MPETMVDGTGPIDQKLPTNSAAQTQRFREFELAQRVFIVTGGGRGLGLEFRAAQKRANPDFGGALHYNRIDVRDTENLDSVIGGIARKHSRLDGLIAAAGIQQVTAAIEYKVEDVMKMMEINYTGVFMTAAAVARQMMEHGCKGSIILVASMSGFIANKGLITPVYNSSKAAVIQCARNLAMEWGPKGIRVNALCPGHIVTPMVQKNFDDDPSLQGKWEKENFLGRLSKPEEFRGAGLFLLSDASSFMTGNSLVIDGGHTAW
ncbi:MAG: hypothetical protein LQ337_000211 [Flavoplaca oasis]|nr:MAG: hypothetical protein LQ337_000211 [Flavoplaca oasis]